MTGKDTNLLDELKEALTIHGYSLQDIDWVGSTSDYTHRDRIYEPVQIELNSFISFAKETKYYAGYGVAKIVMDLVVVMNDGSWFERAEYDGSEWFSYFNAPQKPKKILKQIAPFNDEDIKERLHYHDHVQDYLDQSNPLYYET